MGMDSHRRLDSLTAHIALYHSASSKVSNPNPSPRAAVLRWFSGLTVAHRQSALTVADADFLRVLLQMLSRLRRRGHGFFFLLPDLPSPSLPSLCFRRSYGLLSRAAAADAAERTVADSLLLFASSDDSPLLDAATVAEDLVSDVDRFVAVMDAISGGRFLRGEVNGLAAPWAEMPWLKDKGYYSLEAFVANRLEVALRLSWLSSLGGKKLKGGKAAKEKALTAGLAANVFWRKKGCLDWWAGLDPGGRKKIFEAFLGKAAKSLANEIIRESELASWNELCFHKLDGEFQLRYGPIPCWMRSKKPFFSRKPDFCMDIITNTSSGRPQSLAKYLNCLLVIQEICSLYLSEYEEKIMLFSTLPSADTISDSILRKLQKLLMGIYTNYINVELLGDAKLKTNQNKSQQKSNTGCLKGKKKSRSSGKPRSVPKASKVDSTSCETSVGHECGADSARDSTTRLCSQEETILPMDNQKAKTTTTTLKDHGNGTPSAENDTENIGDSFECKSHTSKKKSGRRRAKTKSKISSSMKVGCPDLEDKRSDLSSLAVDIERKEAIDPLLNGLSSPATVTPLLNGSAIISDPSPVDNSCEPYHEPGLMDENGNTGCMKKDLDLHNTINHCVTGLCFSKSSDRSEIHHECKCDSQSANTLEVVPQISMTNSAICSDETSANSVDPSMKCLENENRYQVSNLSLPMPEPSIKGRSYDWPETKINNSENLCKITSQFVASSINQEGFANDDGSVIQNDSKTCYSYNQTNTFEGKSYEWPVIAPHNFSSFNSQHVPAATERLHLDVGHEWPAYRHQSFLCSRHQARLPSNEGGCNHILPPLTLPMSFDWPPMVKSCTRLSQTVTVSYDSGYNSRLQSSYCTGFSGHAVQNTGTFSENDRIHTGDILDVYDMKNISDLAEDTESYWLSEEEIESHMLSGRDYNQFFGGGVMYWNPAEHVGSGFSRPPSHSSDDSGWAWHEADLNRAIDDMVGVPGLSASYNTNGLASPTATQFCSPFDTVGSGHQSVGYAVSGNDITGKVINSSSVPDIPEEKAPKSMNNSASVIEGVKGDTLPFSMLRPIIVPSMSRRGSRSEFKLGYEHKSPCVPSSRRDVPQIKRPPSPVVLCVPRVPRPPPPSPVGESRKRGFPIVRSGSSSPRHWGVRFSDESGSEESRCCFDGAEVVWPSWGNKGLTTNPMVRSIHGPLLTDHLITIPQLAFDQEHPDVALPLQPPELLNCSSAKTSLSIMHNLLHEEIDFFCKQVAAENLIKKPYINWAVKRVTRSLQVLWPRSRTNIFGSNATGLALPTSDVDIVVSLPPVRNLEPIKEAGILEGRNGIKETCLQHAARYLANQEWVRNDSLKTIENTAIPVIMLVAEVPDDIDISRKKSSMVDIPRALSSMVPGRQCNIPTTDLSSSDCTSWPYSKMKKDDNIDVKSIRLDISFKSASHTGLQTSELVRELTQQFPASVPLALVLKKFLADRSLDHAYSGGLSSYCLVLLIIRFLQHEHHVGRPNNQNLGGLLMDFLYFFGYIFEPRHMRVSIQGSGIYMNRERGLSIDPIHIDDPLYPTNNVGRNCFRIHQCIKAFADAYSVLENELPHFSGNSVPSSTGKFRLLQKIISNIDCVE
uniref:Poly(A) RNA polymerase mitochondrial-like central palm domain-containing protein n=1 Tax=Musa acuminata subsp. malaccensis TaxID=214687 RepID=A0A804IHD0_MUSAM